MRTALCLLSVACLVPLASAQPGRTVYIGDVPSIDKAALQAAELTLPPAVSRGPVSVPKRSTSLSTPSPTPRVAANKPSAEASQGSSQGGGLFGKLKNAWPFGKKKEDKAPATDPFAQAQLQARLAAVATESRSDSITRLGAARPGTVQPIPATASKEPATQVAFNHSAGRAGTPRTAGRSARSSGLPVRKQSTPSGGLLSGWFGGAKPKASPQPSAAQRVATTTPPRTTPPRTAPQPRFASAPKRKPAAEPSAPLPSLASVTVGKREPSSATTVMISDDAPVVPQQPEPAPALVVAEPKPVVTPEPPVERTEPVVLASKPAPPMPTVMITPAPMPAGESAPLAEVTDTPELNPVVEVPAAPTLAVAPAVPVPVADEPRVALQPAVTKPLARMAEVASTPVANPVTRVEPSERSRALLAEAHHLAAKANDYDAYSAVIQRCRYVLAIAGSQQARDYANQLASWGLTKRGNLLDDAGRFDEAAIDYRDALACDGECWKAEHALGVIAAAHGNSQTALRHFDRVIELNPEHAKAFANRAALAVQSGDYEAALNDYAEAIAIDPDLAVAHTGRGRLCHLVGRLDEALRHLDAAAVLDASDPSIAIGRGDLLTDLGRYGQAITAYRRAIALNPAHASAHRNLAWLQATCPVTAFRDGAAALASAEIAEQLAATDDLTLDTKAAALAALGRFAEAADLQREAIDLAPEAEAAPYRERLAMYQKGEAFTSKPVAVQQASYLK